MITGLLLVLACGADPAPTPPIAAAPADGPRAPAELDVAALQARVSAGDIFVLDVRTPEEFADGHVPGATLLPLQELEGRLGELEARRGEEIAVICASGGRSSRATELLRARGFTASNVAGGTRAWVAAGYPTE